jgi:gluconokinase
MIVIVMGVTGAGKTTVAKALVARTGWQFAEGDDFHSEANRKKMHAGVPLNDADRGPWLESLHQVLLDWHQKGENGVMTCSALKQAYRDKLSAGLPANAYRFVLLEAPVSVLEQHLAGRKGHFMNPGLLESQIATLEEPKDAIRIQATRAPEDLAQEILDKIADHSH